jgi:hypothetical protein
LDAWKEQKTQCRERRRPRLEAGKEDVTKNGTVAGEEER